MCEGIFLQYAQYTHTHTWWRWSCAHVCKGPFIAHALVNFVHSNTHAHALSDAQTFPPSVCVCECVCTFSQTKCFVSFFCVIYYYFPPFSLCFLSCFLMLLLFLFLFFRFRFFLLPGLCLVPHFRVAFLKMHRSAVCIVLDAGSTSLPEKN